MTSNNCQYEYMDETSINSELICIICNKPFIEPISTPCDHTFCRECLKRWIEKNKKNCPTCRHSILSIDIVTQVSRPLRNMIDQLRIKCLVCNEMGLQRSNFNDHINKVCPKANVFCSAVDIKCNWTGLREELQKHLATCKCEPLRPLLAMLITENQQLNNEKRQLNEQIQQQNIQINELTNKLSTVNNGKLM
ncbi:unnamed protein product [Rotaria sp. Silwood1]|nr:unnamed protein product [Rotaria sp. Silwood1]